MLSTSKQALARSAVYELLSMAFLYPEPGTHQVLKESSSRLAMLASEQDWPGRARALERLARGASRLTAEGLVRDHVAAFGHTVSPDCPPYGTDYGQSHIFQKAQALAAIVGFYRAFGVEINPTLRDRPDHISVEMEFMHVLTMKEAYALERGHGEDRVRQCREAQEAFLSCHLAPWVRTFAAQLGKKTPASNIFRPLAGLLDAHIAADMEDFRLQDIPPLQLALSTDGETTPDCNSCLAGAGVSAEGGLS